MKRLILILIGAILFSPSIAHAQIITIAITAEVDDVYDPCDHLQGNINISDIITGTYVYDSDALLIVTPVWYDTYSNSEAPSGIFLEAGGLHFNTDPSNVRLSIGVGDSAPGEAMDYFEVSTSSHLPLSTGSPVDTIILEFADSTGTAISNAEIPLNAPILSSWDYTSLKIYEDLSSHPSDGYYIESHVVSALIIPEPGTILLLGIGSFIIAKRRR